MTHPEEPGAADAGATDTASKDEDEAVKKQLIASLGTDEVPKLEVGLPACRKGAHNLQFVLSLWGTVDCACIAVLLLCVTCNLSACFTCCCGDAMLVNMHLLKLPQHH